jgi:transcriptional regulator with XRE-family HTH domain
VQTEVRKQLDPLTVELVRARKDAGWTQNELHQKTGISRDAIKGYESGRNMPGSRELRVLCEALGVSANRVLWGRDDFSTAAGPVKGMFADPAMEQATFALRMFILMGLLTTQEREAVFTLIEPIIVGRKGGREEVRKAFAVAGVLGHELKNEVEKIAETVMKETMTEERMADLNSKMGRFTRPKR